MSVAIVSIPSVRNWRFQYQDKAKNAFLSSGHFSNQTLQRYVFFFTMQRFNENILSSRLKKGLFFLKCCAPGNHFCYRRIFLKRHGVLYLTRPRFKKMRSSFLKRPPSFEKRWSSFILVAEVIA